MKTLDDLKINVPSVRRGDAKDTVSIINTRRYAFGWNDCINYLRAQGLLMVWQPIETAPKDGSFLVFYKGTILEAERSLDGVRSVNDQYGVIYYPKAWMPLPKAGG